MRMNNTNNLIQVEGGEKIKQADKGSWLSFALTDTKRNPIDGINGNTAKVVLYDKARNKGWSYSTTVSDNKVRFKLPGNLEIGIYDLDITVNNMVFPSDRNTKIEIVEGATSFSGAGVSETLLELAGYAKTSDLDKKVDKVSGKGLSTNDYTSTDKGKVSAIPSNPKYTDTTYSAGSGLSLSGTTFSVDSTIARKSDIPSGVDLSEYAKKSDIPNIDTALGTIDLSSYATKTDLSNKIDKVSGKGLSTNDYTSTDKNKVSAIPTSPKYTDTTYSAGSGLSLSGTTFSVDSTIARKDDLKNITNGNAERLEVIDFDDWMREAGNSWPMKDDIASWSKLPAGYYAVHEERIENQPSDYGLVSVLKEDPFTYVVWINRDDFFGKGGAWIKTIYDIDMRDWLRIDQASYRAGYGIDIEDNTIKIDDNVATKIDLNRKVDTVYGKGLSTNDYTNTDKNKVSAIPTNPKYTDTTYSAGSGLSLSGTTFSVDSSIAKKSDLDDITYPRIYTNDDNDFGTATPGKDYFIRNDGRFGKVTSVDKANNDLRYRTQFDFSQLNNLYLPGDIDITKAALWVGSDDADKKKYEPYQNHYYLSRDGYLAKIGDYRPIHEPGYKDRTPNKNYIKFSIEETDGFL